MPQRGMKGKYKKKGKAKAVKKVGTKEVESVFKEEERDMEKAEDKLSNGESEGQMVKQELQECVVNYGVGLDQRLQDIYAIVNDFCGSCKEVSTGEEPKDGGGEGLGKGEAVLLKLVEEVGGKIAEAKSEWDTVREKIYLAFSEICDIPGRFEWENESIADFSGFDSNSIVENDEGRNSRGEAKGQGIGGEGSMDANEMVETVEEYSGTDSSEMGGGFNLEEGFAKIERGIEEKVQKEIKRIENLVLGQRGANERGIGLRNRIGGTAGGGVSWSGQARNPGGEEKTGGIHGV